MTTLTSQLDFLIKLHKEMEPGMAKSYLPGLSNDQIVRKFASINLTPIEEIIELYEWRNGQLSFSSSEPEFQLLVLANISIETDSLLKKKYQYDGLILGFFPYFSYLLPLDRAINYYLNLQAIGFFDIYLFPFLYDSDDEICHFVHMQTGEIYIVNLGDDYVQEYLMYTDFSSMLQTLINTYSTPSEQIKFYLFRSKIFQNNWMKNNQEIGEEAISKTVKSWFVYCY